jgi:hypothetical protein
MKSIKNCLPLAIAFPCLMVSDDGGVTVLMSQPSRGTVVHTTNQNVWELGSYDDDWAMPVFTPLDGEVTLSN